MSHAQQQQPPPWRLNLRFKAKNLDFKYRASSWILPRIKPFKFSIHFKIHPFFFQIKSKPSSSFSWNPKSFCLKLLHTFRNLPGRRSKNKYIAIRRWFPVENNYFHGRRKGCIWLWRILLFASVGYFIVMLLRNYYLRKRFVWKLLLKAWSFTAPFTSAFLYQTSVVILDRICQSLGF